MRKAKRGVDKNVDISIWVTFSCALRAISLRICGVFRRLFFSFILLAPHRLFLGYMQSEKQKHLQTSLWKKYSHLLYMFFGKEKTSWYLCFYSQCVFSLKNISMKHQVEKAVKHSAPCSKHANTNVVSIVFNAAVQQRFWQRGFFNIMENTTTNVISIS